jgi:hypothetical protein
MKNLGFKMPHMEKSDGLSRKSKKQRKAERRLKREMKEAGKKGRESEFMWDPHNEKMVIIPTDDGDSHTEPGGLHLDKMYDILHPGGNWPGTRKDKHDHDDHAAVTND